MPIFSKKAIIIATISTVSVCIIAAIIIHFLTTNNTIVPVTEQSADTLKSQAIEALKNNDKDQAEALFEKAQEQYDELNETDNKTNDQVDVEAQLWLLNHSSNN